MEKEIKTLKFGTESLTTYILRDGDAQEKLLLKADKTELPTKVSQLDNDSGYLTEHQDISGKADKADVYTKTEVDEKVSVKANANDVYTKVEIDAKHYLTEHQDISGKADKADVYTKTEVDTELDKKQDKGDYALKSELPTKVSQLDNDSGYLTEHQDISGKADKATTLAGYGIADVYTKTEVDTELDKKQDKGDYAEKSEVNASITSVMSRLNSLEDKVADMKRINVETTSDVKVATDSTVDYVIKNATIDSSTSTTKAVAVTGKSVELSDATITDDMRLTISAEDGDVELKNVKLEGDFPKATSNAILSVKNADSIVIKDLTLDATSGYNAIELGLSADTLAKNILIDNCKFNGTLSNNAILVFGTVDDCVININNCYFEKLSNVLRLSNKTNAKNVTVNITNCKCDSWEADLECTGMIICQDYTSTIKVYNEETKKWETKMSEELVIQNNLFGDGKITINIINCEGPNGKIIAPDDMSKVCGSGTVEQLIYVWGTKVREYDANTYPILNIM